MRASTQRLPGWGTLLPRSRAGKPSWSLWEPLLPSCWPPDRTYTQACRRHAVWWICNMGTGRGALAAIRPPLPPTRHTGLCVRPSVGQEGTGAHSPTPACAGHRSWLCFRSTMGTGACAHVSFASFTHTHVRSHLPDAHWLNAARRDQPRLSLAVLGTACRSPTTARGDGGHAQAPLHSRRLPPGQARVPDAQRQLQTHPSHRKAPVIPSAHCGERLHSGGGRAGTAWQWEAPGKPTSPGAKRKPAQVLGGPRGVTGALPALVSAPAPSGASWRPRCRLHLWGVRERAARRGSCQHAPPPGTVWGRAPPEQSRQVCAPGRPSPGHPMPLRQSSP